LFVQRTPGKASTYIGCLDLDPIVEPAGDQTLINCRNRDGDVVAIGASYAPPGAVTTGLKAHTFPEADILDLLGRCEFSLYAMMRNCGKAGIFTNYVRGEIVRKARITSRQIDNVVMREADDASIRTLAISGFNPVYRVRMLEVARQAIAETGDLNAIAFCNALQCAGDCGPYIDLGTNGYVVGDAPAGSPTVRADVWKTLDGGAAWTAPTGAAVHPFLAGEDVSAIGCIQMDSNTTRVIAVRAQISGQPLKIAYSDNAGLIWTLVTLGATNNEGVLYAKGLFLFDRDHLFLCTSAGNVYASGNAGATWVASASALSASSAKALNVIHFSDYDHGYAGGVTSALIQTKDGVTWEAVTPPAAMSILSLYAFSKDRVIIGGTAGELYETWDGFVSDIESKTYSGKSAGIVVQTLAFVNDYVGYMLTNTAAPVGSVHRTIDGGHNWEALTTPINAGLNDVVALSENLAFVAGDVYGGTATILKISG
jgi:photosystem II stability/assembly factor-like uncharacterized protein